MKWFAIIGLAIVLAICAYVMYGTATAGDGIRAICNDGTASKSKVNKGTCSRHGGVARWTREE